MEAKIIDLRNIDTLGRLIRSGFPAGKIEVSLNNTHFAAYFDDSVSHSPSRVKAVYDYVKAFLVRHRDPGAEYQFSFYRNHELPKSLFAPGKSVDLITAYLQK